MLRIAACDDQKADIETLEHFLTSYFMSFSYEYKMTQYFTGEALCADYKNGTAQYDLIFLDIYMNGISGMTAAREIRRLNKDVPVIFLTTTPDYALEGYDVRAFGYLVKPLVQEKAAALMARFLRMEYDGIQTTLLLRGGGKGIRISYQSITYAESHGRVLIVHTSDGGQHQIYSRLDDLEQEIGGRGFLRCHQSFLVNLLWVREADDAFVMKDGTQIPIRRKDLKKLRDKYFCYLLEQAAYTKIMDDGTSC